MNISKARPQFVLVATLLVMIFPLLCATMPSRGRRCSGGASCSLAYLFLQREGKYSRLVTVFRKHRVDASSRETNRNSLLMFQTDVSRAESQEEGKLFIHIYNARADRYVCFTRSGRVRTVKNLPAGKRSRHSRLTCRFTEQRVNIPNKNALFTSYVADERHKKDRVITFCGDHAAMLWRPFPRRAKGRHQKHRPAGRRAGRRRHRQKHADRRRRRQRSLTYRQTRKPNRRWCQSVFMKKVPDGAGAKVFS